jgi:hypothetical protein
MPSYAPFRVWRRRALVLAAAASASASASGQVDVAICAAASTSTGACQFTDVQAKLLATGAFNSVDVINVTTGGTGTPTLVQLQAYDALICWTNSTPADNDAWGDVLADYVDGGGGVVVTVFANSTTTAGRNIGGRWQTGYEVILDQSGNASGSASLGTVHVPAHPVMANVATFNGGSSSFRPSGTALEVGSTLIASWSDGRVLVAEGANPQRVDLGFYPPSSTCVATWWDVNTDGDDLMANALLYVASAGGCTGSIANYCTSSTTTNGCNPTMGASGTPSASATSGFTLSCTAVEGQKSGILFYGISGPNAVPWATGSTSFLCVKTPTQRTPTQSSGGTLNACDGVLSIDFLAYLAANPGALGQPVGAGQQFHAQSWFRDPPAPKTTNLSDGIRFTTCP